MNEPAKFRDYQSRPSVRLETFERKDTLVPEMKEGALSGARSFGLDKRLVIASRSCRRILSSYFFRCDRAMRCR
jgi:hypothetical protein